MEGKRIISGKLRVVTPVHIGGAQEKHLQRGLDYIVENGITYFLDEKKIIEKIGIENLHQYSNALANNNLTQLLSQRRIKPVDVSSQQIKIDGEVGTDIKTNIKNPLSNKPIIPGSSLKGSLRSVIYNYLGGNRNNREENLIGNIAEDFFRYIIIHDISFNNSKYINTKTYNLRNAKPASGGWKHNLRGQTTEKFESSGFTFPIETIEINDTCDFEIVLNQKAYKNALEFQEEENKLYIQNNNYRRQNILRISEKSKTIFEEKFDLFAVLKNYTESFLDKEISFFENYKAIYSDKIIEELKRLKELNKESPLLRLGLGSGFHAMTGDTLHNSHLIDEIAGDRGRTRGKLNRKDSAKSRKLAFEKVGEEYKFYPMGFVQFCTDEYFNTISAELARNQEANVAKEQEESRKAKQKAIENELKAKQEAEIAEQNRLEALKPKITDPSTLNKAKLVDAIVVGRKGKMVQFKPYVEGFEDKVFEIGYAAGFEVDTIIQLLCSYNGKTLFPTGSPKEKK